MARPLRIVYEGAFYHVTSRGNEKRPIFNSDSDRKAFLGYLESAYERYFALIHAYCLMENHYHLLIETPEANLPQIMRHINGAYTTYFNVKWDRAGHLFQGRYKAILVEKDAYAMELSRYIHLNPVRAGYVERPEDYQWSSYRNYIGKTRPPNWLHTAFVLGYFGESECAAKKGYREFVEEIVGKEQDSPFKQVVGGALLGTEAFISKIKDSVVGTRIQDKNIPALRTLCNRWSVEQIFELVDTNLEGDERVKRDFKLYLCRKYTSARLKDIGDKIGLGETGVFQAASRLQMRMKSDGNVAKKLKKIEEMMKM
jgi:REP element-mobilizing transposase RayT